MRVFYMVDCQKDFVNPDGALSVPGAEGIKKNVGKLCQYAVDSGIKLYGSVDRHFPSEFGSNPEFLAQPLGDGFPMHCMDGTDGQNVIHEGLYGDALFVPNDSRDRSVYRVKDAEQVFFEKQAYNVHGSRDNPRGNYFVDDVFAGKYGCRKVDECVEFGVATDVCVIADVLEKLECGIDVYLVMDAIKGLAGEKEAISRMVGKGAIPVYADEVLEGL